MKQEYFELPSPQWRTYIQKPEALKAKVFVLGDQEGFADASNKVPYIRKADGTRQAAVFGTHYLTINQSNEKLLVPLEEFKEKYESL